MKTYNKKFKSLGYEHVPEASTATHDEYVKNEQFLEKRIAIIHKGEFREIIITEKIFKQGNWIEMTTSTLSDLEWDAIKSYLENKAFVKDIIWNHQKNKYVAK